MQQSQWNRKYSLLEGKYVLVLITLTNKLTLLYIINNLCYFPYINSEGQCLHGIMKLSVLLIYSQFRKSCAICLSLYIISSPGLNFKCMRDGGPQDIYLRWQALSWYPPVKLQRGRAWLIWHYLNPNNQKVYRHIPIYVYVPLYDKTNSSSDISGLICIDNWLLHRQSHNFAPLYLHVEVLYILDSSGSLFRRIRKSLKILMMLLLQIILGF